MECSLIFEKKRNSRSNPYEDEKSHALKNQGLQKMIRTPYHLSSQDLSTKSSS